MNQDLFCKVKDFQEVIPDLPDNVQLIRVNSAITHLPALGFPTAELILDCEEEMWVRGKKRRHFRKVVYAHFGGDLLGIDYLLYHIVEPEASTNVR